MARMDGKPDDDGSSYAVAQTVIGGVLMLFGTVAGFFLTNSPFALLAIIAGLVGWILFLSGLKDQIIAEIRDGKRS